MNNNNNNTNNNNAIVFDDNLESNTNIVTNPANREKVSNNLDNSTIDYNSLYNLNTDINNQTSNIDASINQIDQKIAEEQIVTPETTALESNQTNENSNESKKGLSLVIVFGILILAAVIFLFPYLIKKGF